MCLSCAPSSPEVTQCLQPKVGTPWLAFKAFLIWPQPTISTFPDLNLPQPNVPSLTRWPCPVLFLYLLQQAMSLTALSRANPTQP